MIPVNPETPAASQAHPKRRDIAHAHFFEDSEKINGIPFPQFGNG
jgi:hypothetical protein